VIYATLTTCDTYTMLDVIKVPLLTVCYYYCTHLPLTEIRRFNSVASRSYAIALSLYSELYIQQEHHHGKSSLALDT
jgi:hypothetical protein